MNVIIQEIKMNLKSLFFWALGICFFVAMAGIEFKSYYGNSTINELMEVMPESMRDAFSMGGSDLSTVTGYMGVIFMFTLLIASAHAATVGAGLLSSEFRNKTSDFVLTLPISRSDILFKKIIGGVAICLIMLAIIFASTMSVVAQYDIETNFFKLYTLMIFGHFILQILFLSIGILASTVFKNPKKSGTFVLGYLGIMYFLQLMQPMHEKLEFLKYITPFKYYDASVISQSLEIEPYTYIISLILIVVSITLSFNFFKSRDITY